MHRHNLILFILVMALASIGLFLGCNSSSDSGTAGGYQYSSSTAIVTKYQFAALQSPDHPVLTALKERGVNLNAISEDLQAERESLVVDGSQMTASELYGNETVKKYLEGGKGILVLNATSEHKKALGNYIGLAYGSHDTRGYFVIAVPGSGGREFAIYEHPVMAPIGASNFSSDTNFTVDKASHDAWQTAFEDQVKSAIGPKQLAANIINQLEENRALREGTKSRDSSIPQGLKNYIWHIPNDTQYWSMQGAWLTDYPNTYWVYPAGKPAVSYQVGSFGHTTTVTLYLDNRPANGGADYQWLSVDFQGWNENQKPGPNSTYEKKKSYAMAMDGENHNVMNSENYEAKGYGWGLMKYFMSFVPTGSTAGIKNYQALPATDNSSSSYTSGSNFTVGFNAAGMGSASYTINNTTTTTQKDWIAKVQTDLSKPSYAWEWASNNPDADGHKAEHMNDINLYSFQPASSAVMKTDSVLTDVRTFSFTYGPTLISQRAYSDDVKPTEHWKYDSGLNPLTYNLSIDFSKVLYPIPMSLTTSPAYPSAVTGGQNASGTITLDQNAPKGGITVALTSSNTAWATVPATVVIPEGSASASFTITTKAVTTDSTATISASLNSVKITTNLAIKAQ